MMSVRHHPIPPERPWTASRLEMHAGIVTGVADQQFIASSSAGARHAASARSALEASIRGHARGGPLLVQFSGGRDSSLVLAVAAHVARTDSLPAPRAITIRYPGVPEADESEWQELVLRHLGLEQEIIEVGLGEDDLASTTSLAAMADYGATYPPAAPLNLRRLAPHVRGCTVLTGEGGDELLGPARASVHLAPWRARRRPSRAALGDMAFEALPYPVRRRVARQRLVMADIVPWLRPDPSAFLQAQLVEDQVASPWRWDRSRWQSPHSRMWMIGSSTMDAIAKSEGFTLAHPLMESSVVAAVARAGGPTGPASRTHAMRLLAGDLLPEAILGRSSKVTFNRAYAGEHTRRFARRWDGSGVDPDLVDIERLRAEWCSDDVTAFALPPLALALAAEVAR